MVILHPLEVPIAATAAVMAALWFGAAMLLPRVMAYIPREHGGIVLARYLGSIGLIMALFFGFLWALHSVHWIAEALWVG